MGMSVGMVISMHDGRQQYVCVFYVCACHFFVYVKVCMAVPILIHAPFVHIHT